MKIDHTTEHAILLHLGISYNDKSFIQRPLERSGPKCSGLFQDFFTTTLNGRPKFKNLKFNENHWKFSLVKILLTVLNVVRATDIESLQNRLLKVC